MPTKEELGEAKQLIEKIRDSYIPPGPFLGGREWRITKEEAIKLLLDWKIKDA